MRFSLSPTRLLTLALTVAVAMGSATALAAPGVIDPDAAAGLDRLDWNPPVGTTYGAVSPPGKRDLGSTRYDAASNRPQGADPEASGAVLYATYCTGPDGDDRVVARGCWWEHELRGEEDPSADYFFQSFQAQGRSEDGHRLQRLKGRNFARNGENVKWAPGGDASYGDPKQIGIGVSFGYAHGGGSGSASVSQTLHVFPGKIHPFSGDQLFHSSWVANGNGAKHDSTVESVGVNVWKVPAGERLVDFTGGTKIEWWAD